MIGQLLFIHNEEDPGPSFDITTQPLQAGTTTAGYYGEFTNEDLVTQAELTTLVGFDTTGSSMLNETPGWLHFASAGKHLLVAKMPLRSGINYDALNNVGAALGTKIVKIKGFNYKVRMMTGSIGTGAATAGGEWNDLMYNVCTTGPSTQGWATFTIAQLGIKTATPGNYSMCQDMRDGTNCWMRGTAINGITYVSRTSRDQRWGWRPVLELVS